MNAMAAASSQVGQDNIAEIAGPLLLGYTLNWGAYGIVCIQFCLYYLGFEKDPPRFRWLVYVVFALLTVQTLFLTRSAFRTFATGFLDTSSLDQTGTLWFSVSLINGTVTLIIQLFYAYRIKILGQSPYIPTFIAALSLCQGACAVFVGASLKRAVLFSRFVTPVITITSGVWCATGVICDATIAIYMIYYLSRTLTGCRKTTIILQRLIRLTIETGALTTAVALLNFISFLIPGKPTYYQTSASLLGKVYAFAMLALLNNRLKLVDGSFQEEEVEIKLEFMVRSQDSEENDFG